MKNSSRSRRSQSSSRWVVEIGAAHVAAGRFESSGESAELVQLAHRDLPVSEATDDLEVAGLEAALRELIAELAIRGDVLLVVPGHLALTKMVRVPAVAETQRPKLIEFEVRQGIPFDLDQVYWSHHEQGIHAGEVEVMVVAAKKLGLDRLLVAAKSAGLRVSSIVAAGPTLLAAQEVVEAGAALISVGARATHLVFQDGQRTHLRTLTLAGNSVSQEIANSLTQSLADAEQLKVGVLSGQITLPAATPAGAAVKAAVEGFGARLRLEFDRTVVTQVRPAGITLPATLHVAGGGARLPGLAEALRSTNSPAVQLWELPTGLAVNGAAADVIARVGIERFADLVGAFRRATPGGGVELDLAPRGMREARAAKRQRPRWLAAAALLVLAAYLPGWHYQRLASARSEAADTMRQAVVPVQVLRDRTTAHLAELDRLRESAAVWEARRQSQHAWEALLADLQGSLSTTGDVWLERMQVLPLEALPGDAGEDRARINLRISGRLLDRENPLSRVSQNAYERVTSLLESFLESPRITDIEGERFDASEPGMLRFDFTLVINPRSGL